MKLVEKPNTVQSRGVQSTVKFGIKADGISHIFHVLRNQLYSDKVTAVIREYSTNAADAHVEVGKLNKPIEVTLPSRFNPVFSIRDFGPSLSEDEIKDVFAYYGESTKRNTNTQTGMLGIGSKSAFAYGDNFVITAYLDGKKHTYNAFIDDTKVGQISKLSEEESSEETGLEITVPINTQDVDEFHEKSKEVFRYFEVKPIVNGKQLEYSKSETLYSGNGWAWQAQRDENHRYGYGHRGEPVVIMGNIGYPIDVDQLKLEGDDSALSNFACANLRLELQIGDVEISASREALQYTDYTIKSIQKKLKQASKEIVALIEKSFSDCESLWQAKVLSGELFDYSGSLHSCQSLIKKEVRWRGKVIGDTAIHPYAERSSAVGKIAPLLDSSRVEIHEYEQGYRGNRKVKAAFANTVSAQANTLIVLNEKPHRRGAMNRLVAQVEEEGKKVYIITLKDQKFKNNALKSLGMIEDDVVMLESLPEKKLDVHRYGSPTGVGTKNNKHSKKIFSFKGEGKTWGQQSSWWKTDEVDLEGDEAIVYVAIDRFKWQDNILATHEQASHSLQRVIESVKSAGWLKDVTIYGVKPKELQKFQDAPIAISLGEFLKSKALDEIESKGLGQELASIKAYSSLGQTDNWRRVTELNLDLIDKNSVLAAFLQEVKRVAKKKHDEKDKVNSVRSILSDLNIQVEGHDPKVDLVAIEKCVLETYPMLEPLMDSKMGNWRWNGDKEIQKEVKKLFVSYVNLVDNFISRDL